MKPTFGNNINAIGVMSGTSLDGMDIVAVQFLKENESWNFSIKASTTIPYSGSWLNKLKNAPSYSGEALAELNSEFGRLTGKLINEFVAAINFRPAIIASHGHTIFHQPHKHFTMQIGNGAEISAVTNTTTVADFRITDVALGGQGAPLVPIGDKLLFGNFDYCLNLGGFANVSFEQNNKRIAFDVCPTNFVLNYFAQKQGLKFDKNGELGKNGKINLQLLEEVNNLAYYQKKPPKSLGREWMEEIFFPVIKKFNIPDIDKMRTIYEHIAIQISTIGTNSGDLLVTGGGAFNTFLLERIKYHSNLDIKIPDSDIINYKEALIFAFLGILRVNDQINCLSSVTGASKDSSCGIIFNCPKRRF